MSDDARRAALLFGAKYEIFPPVTVSALGRVSRRMGVRVKYHNRPDAIGCLLKEHGVWVVELATDVSPQRTLFTYAHELGHLYRRRTGMVYSPAEESWCNEFAAELLAPGPYVANLLDGNPTTLATLQYLADSTGLSLFSAHLRAQKVAQWRTVLISFSRSPTGRWRFDSVSPRTAFRLESARLVARTERELDMQPTEAVIELMIAYDGIVFETVAESLKHGGFAWVLAPNRAAWARNVLVERTTDRSGLAPLHPADMTGQVESGRHPRH